ncbi:hypothetical protein [Lysinibacillus sp. LZ02]|uniref:hypothetical protein n=1 Tax=Lysinibacillus sp. LZ02 TaxID=3420668 RepID=UPI003D36DF65
MDLTVLFVVAIAILGIIKAFVQVVKITFKLANQYVPIVSVAVDILIGIAVWPITEYSIYIMALGGAMGGLTACGTFDFTKVVKSGDK